MVDKDLSGYKKLRKKNSRIFSLFFLIAVLIGMGYYACISFGNHNVSESVSKLSVFFSKWF